MFYHSFRKIIFIKSNEFKSGIIIGQTKRDEGEYFPRHKAISNDPEDENIGAFLKLTKRYTFWIVATE